MLTNMCHTNIPTKENSFVGLTFYDGTPTIYFPLGYNFNRNNEEEIRKDICLLLTCIQNNNCAKLKDEQESVNNKLETASSFPFLAYKFIIEDYLRNGVYHEMTKKYSRNNRGKINWKKTIKNITPYIQDDSFVFNDYIVETNDINQMAVLTNIHQYCIYISCKKLGWLYNDIKYKKPNILINKKFFTAILKKYQKQTYNDEKRTLLIAMINVIQGLDDNSEDKKEFKVGTNRFEYLWEYMLDKKFGVENKKVYFPHATWHIGQNNTMKPPLELDTIFFDNNNAYIIDAKYYKYGVTNNTNDLPETSTIAKQIIYGQYVAKKNDFVNVYNAFIMPYKSENDACIKYLGYANGDWVENDLNHEKIKLIIYDTKQLMQTYKLKSINDKNYLIKLMEMNNNNENS